MVRRGKRTSKWKFRGFDKREKYALLLLGMIIVLGGASVAFESYAWGYESVWGADVQYSSIKFSTTTYDNPSDLPEYSYNVGARTITSNFDGNPNEVFAWAEADYLWGNTVITYADAGMFPTVNYDLSRFKYYNNVTEEIGESAAFLVYDNTNETIDVHFYFGFSIAFSTAAYSIPMPLLSVPAFDPPRVYVPGPESNYGWRTQSYVESAEVTMTTTVAVRFESLLEDSDFQYAGTLNEITVIGERAYYVTQPPGTDYETISEFNANYDWNTIEHVVPGYAQAVGEPQILYDVINSDTEKMATIEATAKLRPAVDPIILNEVSNAQEGYVGYIVVGGVDVFNVGFIYDIVADVSINDIPVYDESAILALGRYGINLPIPPPEPWYLSPLILILVLAISFILARRFF